MKKYMLKAEYIKFITIEDDEDLDEAMDENFEMLPVKPCGDCDWELMYGDWEVCNG